LNSIMWIHINIIWYLVLFSVIKLIFRKKTILIILFRIAPVNYMSISGSECEGS